MQCNNLTDVSFYGRVKKNSYLCFKNCYSIEGQPYPPDTVKRKMQSVDLQGLFYLFADWFTTRKV